MWNSVKVVPRGKFIALIVILEKKKRSKINNVVFYFRKPETRDQVKYKVSPKNNNNYSRNQ